MDLAHKAMQSKIVEVAETRREELRMKLKR